MPKWCSIPCRRDELNLDVVLLCGQSFRWSEVEAGIFRSTLGNHVLSLKQDDTNLFYHVHSHQHHECNDSDEKREVKCETQRKCASESNCEKVVRTQLEDYFQLHISSLELHHVWSKHDKHFDSGLYKNYSGIRVLRQDPVENLFSFICSANNNISRISSMVEKLTLHFGQKLLTLDSVDYHKFPTIEALAKEDTEEILRRLGFGYRAKYIMKSAQFMCAHGGEEWLYALRDRSYDEAKQELLKLHGVGDKVADCVLLMSLDKHGAIPVDTHIASIARKNYLPNLPGKTISKMAYKQIGDHLRALWGEYAGWAQAVVFSADLPKYAIKPEVNSGLLSETKVTKQGRKLRSVRERASDVTLSYNERETAATHEAEPNLSPSYGPEI